MFVSCHVCPLCVTSSQSPEFQELLNDPEKLQEAIHSNPLINGMPMMKQ